MEENRPTENLSILWFKLLDEYWRCLQPRFGTDMVPGFLFVLLADDSIQGIFFKHIILKQGFETVQMYCISIGPEVPLAVDSACHSDHPLVWKVFCHLGGPGTVSSREPCIRGLPHMCWQRSTVQSLQIMFSCLKYCPLHQRWRVPRNPRYEKTQDPVLSVQPWIQQQRLGVCDLSLKPFHIC